MRPHTLTPLLAATLTVALTGLPAHAAANTPTFDDAPPLEVDAPAFEDNADRPDAGYSSLAASLAQFHADRSNMAFGDILNADPDLSARVFGTTTLPDAADLGSFNRQLGTSNASFSTDSFDTFEAFRDQLSQDNSFDTFVATNASRHSLNQASLRMPDLAMPNVPDAAFNRIAPDESLAFGQMYRNSMASFVGEFPDVYGDIQTRGTFDDNARAAFTRSLEQGAARTTSDFSDLLPAPCLAGMLSATASGSRQGAADVTGNNPNCTPCVVSGLYMHQDLTRVTNPSWNLLRNEDGTDLSTQSWESLDPRIRDQNPEANPHREGGVLARPSAPSATTRDCDTADAAARATAEDYAPDVADVLDRLFR